MDRVRSPKAGFGGEGSHPTVEVNFCFLSQQTMIEDLALKSDAHKFKNHARVSPKWGESIGKQT